MRANNFDLIRFALAGIVVLFHAHALSQSEPLAFLPRYFSPDIAVKGFFVVSGYLILRSWDGSSGLTDFSSKRARRIYPAYATVVLGSAFIGAVVTILPLGQYFSSHWLGYVGANLSFLNFLAPALPGVFAGNPETAVNGALWTLKIEVMFYTLGPALAWLIHRRGAVAVAAALYVASVAYSLGMHHAAEATGRPIYLALAHQLPGQLSFFMTGAALYYKEKEVRRWLLPGAAVSIVLLAVGGPFIDLVLQPLLLGLTVIYFAVGLPHLGNFGRFGDFSYGMYIIHFPLLQWMVWNGWFRDAPWTSLLLACVATLAAAYAMWHLVERRFLFRSSHYVAASLASAPDLP